MHFFCETADVTRPFPSRHSATAPNPEFAWNGSLGQPFWALGLGPVCPVLLQGVASTHQDADTANGQVYLYTFLSKRACGHPGTRYIARGLNAAAHPGNELECEQLVFTGEGRDTKWTRWVDVGLPLALPCLTRVLFPCAVCRLTHLGPFLLSCQAGISGGAARSRSTGVSS